MRDLSLPTVYLSISLEKILQFRLMLAFLFCGILLFFHLYSRFFIQYISSTQVCLTYDWRLAYMYIHSTGAWTLKSDISRQQKNISYIAPGPGSSNTSPLSPTFLLPTQPQASIQLARHRPFSISTSPSHSPSSITHRNAPSLSLQFFLQ